MWLVSATAEGAWQAPLTSSEIEAAQNVALLEQSSTAIELGQGRSKSTHPLGVQVLLVKPLERKKKAPIGSPKIAEVFLFDYQTHTATLSAIDLSNQVVIRSRPISGVHLPLSNEEIAYSIETIERNVEVQEKLQQEHSAMGHNPNSAVMTGLQIRVSIWVPMSSEQAHESRCDYERCALLSLFDADDVSYATEPGVNVKTGEVHLGITQ